MFPQTLRCEFEITIYFREMLTNVLKHSLRTINSKFL